LQALEAQQKKHQEGIERGLKSVNELQTVYAEIRVRADLIQRLSAALEDIERRYQDKVQQVKLISSPLANPFDITADVTRSNQPVEPNPWLIVAIAVVGGLGLGLGLAVVLEYSKNCFRSVHDISRVMVVPVLGNINTIVTRREARLRALKRALVGVSSAVFIGSVFFVTWAWAKNPDLLSPDVRGKIEELRSRFR
jgi:capsular polysaccharide biosynthesis protein